MSSPSKDATGNLVELREKKKSIREKIKELAPPIELPILKNWYEIEAEGKTFKMALTQNALVDQFLALMPNCVAINETLHLINNEELKPLKNAKKLAVAIRKKDILLDFQEKLPYGLPWEHFYEAVLEEAPQYTSSSKYPRWPLIKDHLSLKHIEPKRNGKLDEFADFFSCSRPVDKTFLKALFCSPSWSNGWGQRPLFVIGGENANFDDDQGTGKSTVVGFLEKIYGISAALPPGLSLDRMIALLQSIKNQGKLIIKMDNLRGTLENSTLEGYITDPWIGGYKLGEGASQMRNEYTFVATANSPHFNKDSANRSCFLKLKRPESPSATWQEEVDLWLQVNEALLLQDIGGIICAPPVICKVAPSVARWGRWLSTILNKLDPNAHKIMAEGQDELQATNDHEILHERLVAFVTHYYRATESSKRLDPETDCLFVTNDLMFEIYKEAFSVHVKKTPHVFVNINKMLNKLGFLKTKMGIRIDGLGQVKGFVMNYDPNCPQRPVFILSKHHKSGASGVFHQPSFEFKEYLV